jgi:cytochrome c-type biogenesis protein CcmF
MLGVWLVLGAGVDFWQRAGRGDLRSRLGRITRLPRADWGKAVAHAGFGVTIFGVSAVMAWQSESIRVAQIGETFQVAGYDIKLADVKRVQGPNYTSTMAEMVVMRNGKPVAVMHPEKRMYPVAGMATTEAAIDNGVLRDLYLVIGDPQADGGWAVRTYVKPFASWIWSGAIIMALGGALSLSDRRYRVAAGARRSAASAAAPVAAE